MKTFILVLFTIFCTVQILNAQTQIVDVGITSHGNKSIKASYSHKLIKLFYLKTEFYRFDVIGSKYQNFYLEINARERITHKNDSTLKGWFVIPFARGQYTKGIHGPGWIKDLNDLWNNTYKSKIFSYDGDYYSINSGVRTEYYFRLHKLVTISLWTEFFYSKFLSKIDYHTQEPNYGYERASNRLDGAHGGAGVSLVWSFDKWKLR